MVLVFLVRHVPIIVGAKSTIAHLPVDKLKIMPLLLPQIRIQRTIVEKLRVIDEKILSEEKRMVVLEELFKSLLHQLMTGTIRVPIGKTK
jgi:type I restriction enzyme S subunit